MLRILLTVALCVIAMPGLAQDYSTSLKVINELNRIQAPQNPNFERSEKILTRRVTDKKNHVIGEVEDVIFRSNGGLKSIQVEFDRLRLAEPVYINYHGLDVRTAGRSYQLDFDDSQIASIYPQLLADVESAAGEGSDEFSLKKTLGSPVVGTDGRGVGIISDVLFSSDGDRVEALYIRMTDGALNGKQVAIPVDNLQMTDNGQKLQAVVTDDVAKAMNDFAGK